MPFSIVRNDITNMQVDAIVNTANPKPVIGLGTDSSIHEKAGPKLLLARKEIGNICVGSAEITPGYELAARYVIHTVGPVWEGGCRGEEALLRGCYESSLKLALEYNCRSVAFPLISSGNYGFPKDKALQIAISAFSAFLLEHELQIFLVVYDRASFSLSEKLFSGIASYIDENYIAQQVKAQDAYYRSENRAPRRYAAASKAAWLEDADFCMAAPMAAPIAAPTAAPSLKEELDKVDEGFSQRLLWLIDATGKKDSEIYSRANISRQHFSKIRNNPDYRPTKATALAFAIALELDMADTRDLIGRAGYALTRSSKFDVILMYFIEKKNYNIFDINAALFEFDQTLLGA